MTRSIFGSLGSPRHRAMLGNDLNRILWLSLFLFFDCLVASSFAATLPAGFTEFQVANGIASPTAMAIAPDGRIFVCEQQGTLRVIKNGSLLSNAFISLPVDSNGERGLLGVAFDPAFATNQFVYVYYTTATAPVHNRVSRFTANGDVAVAGSEVVLLELDNPLPSATAHNGGALHFGLDGKLYIAVGDHNGSSNAQLFNSLHGKMLRLNADGTIPTDNPFYNTATGNYRAIWALGLRNPFTFAIQPGTGRIFINDVGQAAYEEINDGIAGSNYGWPTCEGPCNPPNASFRDALYTYGHTGENCAITGGAFYNPTTARFPSSYVGKYFFTDLCAGTIKTFDPTTNTVADFSTGSSYSVDLDVSPEGYLYYLRRGNGQVWRIDYTANQAPAITQQPENAIHSVGEAATFTVAATGATPFTYQWQRNSVNITGATSASYTLASTALGDNGAQFRCIVTNSFGTATSNAATLTVTTDQRPTATITTPIVGTTYQAGQTISYSGTGTDPETGNLPASAFTWRVDFHHHVHTHPHVPPTSGATSGSFVIPTIGETDTDVWYRIHLTVTDPFGFSTSVYRDILPQKSTLTLQTNPAGLQVTLDGSPQTTPVSKQSVVGMQRTLGVISPQNLSGTNYVFSSWSDGSAATHTITTPSVNTTYTASYTLCSSISPASQTIEAAGGNGTVNVTSQSGCPWTATSNAAWIAITAGSSGSGNGSVNYSVAVNPGAQRTGMITIDGRTFTITQSGGSLFNLTVSLSSGGTKVTVNWTAPSGRPATDWLGLYRAGEPDTAYLSAHYTQGATSGSWVVQPTQAGQYEVRYFLQDGYMRVAQSNAVTVSYAAFSVTATAQADGSVTVNWAAPSGHAGTDWLGLYRVGDADTAYQATMYTGSGTSGSWVVRPAQAGQYEVRYFLDNSYTKATQSNPVTIP
jgi:glucose/arabinose dehydrogenase